MSWHWYSAEQAGSGRSLTSMQHTGPGSWTHFLPLLKQNLFFIILFIFLACFHWVKTVQWLFQSRGLWVNLDMWQMVFRFKCWHKWGVSGDRNSPVSPGAAVQCQSSVRLAVPVEQMLEVDNGFQLLLQAAVFITKGWADYFEGTGHDSALMFFSVAALLLLWCRILLQWEGSLSGTLRLQICTLWVLPGAVRTEVLEPFEKAARKQLWHFDQPRC